MFSLGFAQDAKVVQIDINTAIGPATSTYVQEGMRYAQQENASAILLTINTPGGLATSMRDINQTILASNIPVLGFVYPKGARAASAGTFILYASHLAAMAPASNLGAATPVAVGISGALGDKKLSPQMNKAQQDATASIVALAQTNHRNVDFAKAAVLEGASITAQSALEQGVINFIADNPQQALEKAQNRTYYLKEKPQTFTTPNPKIETYAKTWRIRFLETITNPNIAYLLLIVGFWAVVIEITHPGLLLPGLLGIVSLLVGLYAMQLLPISYVGLSLIGFGLLLFVAELFVTSFGVLALCGTISFVIGSIMLLDQHDPAYRIAMPLIIATTIVMLALFALIFTIVVRVHRRKSVIGETALIDQTGTITIDEDLVRVRIHGECWQVRSKETLVTGDVVQVTAVDNLHLVVKKIKES